MVASTDGSSTQDFLLNATCLCLENEVTIFLSAYSTDRSEL